MNYLRDTYTVALENMLRYVEENDLSVAHANSIFFLYTIYSFRTLSTKGSAKIKDIDPPNRLYKYFAISRVLCRQKGYFWTFHGPQSLDAGAPGFNYHLCHLPTPSKYILNKFKPAPFRMVNFVEALLRLIERVRAERMVSKQSKDVDGAKADAAKAVDVFDDDDDDDAGDQMDTA
jgi:hypothetical protein